MLAGMVDHVIGIDSDRDWITAAVLGPATAGCLRLVGSPPAPPVTETQWHGPMSTRRTPYGPTLELLGPHQEQVQNEQHQEYPGPRRDVTPGYLLVRHVPTGRAPEDAIGCGAVVPFSVVTVSLGEGVIGRVVMLRGRRQRAGRYRRSRARWRRVPVV